MGILNEEGVIIQVGICLDDGSIDGKNYPEKKPSGLPEPSGEGALWWGLRAWGG